MSDEELLRLRAEAQAALAADRAEADADMLRMHENALAALRDPALAEDIRLETLLTTRAWEDSGMVSEDLIPAGKPLETAGQTIRHRGSFRNPSGKDVCGGSHILGGIW